MLTPLQIRANRLLTGLIVAASLAIVLSSALLERDLRDAAAQRAETELRQQARLFAQHADDAFQLADTVLTGVRHIVEHATSRPEALALLDGMLRGTETRPRLKHVAVIDADGGLLASTSDAVTATAAPGAAAAIAARLADHRATPDRDLRLGAPVVDAASGRGVIPLSLRLDDVAGRFVGMVVAAVDTGYFAAFCKPALAERGGEVTISYDGGSLLLRGDAAPAGGPAVATAAATVLRHHDADGTARVTALQPGPRFALAVTVTRADDAAPGGWSPGGMRWTLVRGGIASLFLAAGLVMVAQNRRRQAALNALRQSEREFRALAEGSGDAVLRVDLDGRILYASPISAEVFERPVETLVGRQLSELALADEEAGVTAALSDAAEGVATRARFFVDAGDKRTRRLSATLSVTGSGDGRAIIAVVRDETEVYLAERALTSLAATDALTGLANRRVFTEKLDQEWRRAAREDTPLSLLFIDVDRFKRFNDTYGHLQGDRCLRSIAEVIARAVTRAADLPARYGGEEFVLLLPNTDAHGARRVAEHIRATVEALAIPHVGGVGDGARVTVSVGVATQRPREPAQTTEGLLLAADRVLYEAKATGRNRVCGGDAPPEPFDVEWRAAPAPAAPARGPGRAGRPV